MLNVKNSLLQNLERLVSLLLMKTIWDVKHNAAMSRMTENHHHHWTRTPTQSFIYLLFNTSATMRSKLHHNVKATYIVYIIMLKSCTVSMNLIKPNFVTSEKLVFQNVWFWTGKTLSIKKREKSKKGERIQ